jgi:methionyl-tRNA formyltransferase
MINIVFFGTPNYVLPVLDKLHKSLKSKNIDTPVVAVVTKKPKPTGRKKLLSYTPVDTWAHKKKVPIYFEPEKLIKNNVRAQVGILASYGQIVSKKVINHFPHGILNVHPSLLPEFRGASPVQATIVSGKKEAGVTIIRLDEELDHGPIVSQFIEDIKKDDTTKTLREHLFNRSSDVLATLIPAYIEGKVKTRKQEHEKATFTRQIKKDDAFIDPKALEYVLNGKTIKKKWRIEFIKDFTTDYSPSAVYNFIRAMRPWPVAWTLVKLNPNYKETKRLKIIKSHLEPAPFTTHNTQSTELILDEVQLEGKNPVSWKQFTEGYTNAKFTN